MSSFASFPLTQEVVFVERDERSAGSVYAEDVRGDTVFMAPINAAQVFNEPCYREVSGVFEVQATWKVLNAIGDCVKQFVKV